MQVFNMDGKIIGDYALSDEVYEAVENYDRLVLTYGKGHYLWLDPEASVVYWKVDHINTIAEQFAAELQYYTQEYEELERELMAS